MDDDDWNAEYRRLSAALHFYHVKLSRKTHGPDAPQPLSEAERVFVDLWLWWSAALVNNDDVFGWLELAIECSEDFRTIGANGTLEAIAQLMPYYAEQQSLPTEDQKTAYWVRTEAERAPAETLAEGVNEFAQLLLAHAQKHNL